MKRKVCIRKEIRNNFTLFSNEKIEPQVNVNGVVVFNLYTGDERSEQNIKISKGEESLFKWVVFYTVIQRALALLQEKEEDRSLDWFNNLQYIIIDDPVTSLDDYRIYTIALQVLDLIELIQNHKLNIQVLMLTHHLMFYNILANTIEYKSKNIRNYKAKLCIMLKRDNEERLIDLKQDKTSLTYHLLVLKEIKQAIEEGVLRKIHFNMFRSVAEKMSVILGYKSVLQLFNEYSNQQAIYKVLNMNSHDRFSDLESNYLQEEQINIFVDGFNFFINNFKIKL